MATPVAAQESATPDPWRPHGDAVQQLVPAADLPALLERAVAALAEGVGRLGDDAVQRGQCARFVERLVHRLHTAVKNGEFPPGEPALSLLRRIDAALAISGAMGTRVLIRVESLRALLGDWRQALERLGAVPTDSGDRQSAVLQMLQICQQYRSLEHGWKLCETWEREGLPHARAFDAADYWRLRCGVLTSVGMLDAAAAALARAEEQLAAAGAVSGDARARFDATAMDLLLVAGRHDEATELAHRLLAAPDIAADTRNRARLGAALAKVRRGDDAAALTELATIARSTEPYGQMAVGELVLVHLRAGRRGAARELAARWATRPLSLLRDHELVPLAWCALADDAAAVTPLVPLADLHRALSASYRWLLAQWQAVPPETSGVPFLHLAGRRDLLAALCAITLRRDGQAAVATCLDHVVAAEALGSTARSLGIAARPFAQLREAVVPRGGRLLAYLPAPTYSWLFVVDAATERAVPLASDATLRSAVRRLRSLVHTPPAAGWQEELRTAAAAVADWCLPTTALAGTGDGAELTIVGRELLRGVPFEVLPWQGDALGATRAVCYLPSMTLTATLPARAAERTGTVVLAATEVDATDGERYRVVGIPVPAARFAAIAGAGGDVIAPASRGDLLTGVGSRAGVAIVFAHGIVDASRPVPFGLLLDKGSAASGAVFAPDVKAAADVVLLAACGLGAGGFRSGEDGGHRLSGAFLRNGARVVVSADADLPFDATRFWAEQFTAALRENASPAAAARRARRATSAEPGWTHPWFHAQLHVEGRGHTGLSRLTERATGGR